MISSLFFTAKTERTQRKRKANILVINPLRNLFGLGDFAVKKRTYPILYVAQGPLGTHPHIRSLK